MAKNINYVSHKKSKVKNNGKPQLPSANSLVEGEIAINYAENVETLSIKNESGTVVTFSSDNYYSEQKLGSAFTGSNSATTVTDALNNISSGSEVEVNTGDTPTASTVDIWIDESIDPATVEVYSKSQTNALLDSRNGYGTCSTASATAAKQVTINGFVLGKGSLVGVLFTNAFSATNPTLNINNTTAHAIRLGGAAITPSLVTSNSVVTMLYDGTYYQVISILNA